MNWDKKMLSTQGGEITQGGRTGGLAALQPAFTADLVTREKVQRL